MKHDNRMLWAASGMGMAAVAFAAAGLTISIVSAASPPVSKYLSADQNADHASRLLWFNLPFAVVLLVLAFVNMAQVMARRPFLTSDYTLRNWIVSRRRVVGVTIAFGAVLAMWGWSLSAGLSAIAASMAQGGGGGGGGTITDSLAFGGLTNSFNLPVIAFGCLSGTYLLRWWQVSNGVTPRST